MWTPEITRARYVEAAATERFLPADRGPCSKGYWPEFFHDEEDKAGWDDAAHLDNAEKWKGRASNGAISRHQECVDWAATMLRNDNPRRLLLVRILWSWAFCRANGWDFGSRCVKKGLSRPTAYRRLAAIVEQITANLNNGTTLLRLPEEKYLRHETTPTLHTEIDLARSDAPAPIKFSPGYRTEKSRDLIRTPEDADTFAKFLERRNARLRKLNAWRNEQGAA